MRRWFRLAGFACGGLLLFSTLATADAPRFIGGHIKGQLLVNELPDDSLFLDEVDSPAVDQNADLRLKFNWSGERLSLDMDYQLIGRHGDQVLLSRRYSGLPVQARSLISDKFRLFDLTDVISQDEDSILAQRLDRLALTATGDKSVLRVGRQAVSWGNGLIYTPMDIFNPFDPATVDKEYKTGDDMVYGQYLSDSGDDLQAVWVVRRDAEGDVSSDVDSTALKYHGFVGATEYDLLAAVHFDEPILGMGGIMDIGGAILRGDLTLTDTEEEIIPSLVSNLSYSWVAGGHNFSGVLEYFYNGFGQENGDYSAASLAENSDLTRRIARGELFTLGRHYVAASTMIEMTPLWLLTPNFFINASDASMLVQLVSSHDFRQNWQLLAALSVPVGPPGTEFGGLKVSDDDKTIGGGIGLFLQLAWYF